MPNIGRLICSISGESLTDLEREKKRAANGYLPKGSTLN
jgi:hypothetical protein